VEGKRSTNAVLESKSRGLAQIINNQKNSPIAHMPPVPFEEVLSFLKETRGVLSWKIGELVDSLEISEAAAKQIVAILELQGYVKHETGAGETEWLTTLTGETISGSVAPRFNLKRVKEELAALAKRIKAINRDRRAKFRIARAVAVGDFLSARTRVQAADVGVLLESRQRGVDNENSAEGERQFLKQLRGGSALIHVQIYKPWMSKRSHLRLI
jgi:hypothetical protein